MIIWTIIGFFIGAILGSFFKALADRSLKNKTFSGRSYCPHCKKTLLWYDLLPIISYIILRGKCRFCHKKIGSAYFITEVTFGIIIAFLFWTQYPLLSINGDILQLILFLSDLTYKTLFISVLLSLAITDLRETLIPDRISIPAIVIGLFFLTIITIYKIGYLYYYLSQNPIGRYLLPPESDYFRVHAMSSIETLISAIFAALLLAGFFLFLIIITFGRGMGGGDVKLGAIIGLGLGFPQAVLAMGLGFLTGALTSVVLILLKRKSFGQTIPFGPFLVLGSLLTLFWGDKILRILNIA